MGRTDEVMTGRKKVEQIPIALNAPRRYDENPNIALL
jgi:hypothetical protein